MIQVHVPEWGASSTLAAGTICLGNPSTTSVSS